MDWSEPMLKLKSLIKQAENLALLKDKGGALKLLEEAKGDLHATINLLKND